MPPIANHGLAPRIQRFSGGPDQVQAGCGPARLGRGGPARADAEVVDILVDRGVHLCAVVGRAADQRAGPDDVAGHREREVVLPEVQHVGPRGASDVGPVVDGQQGPVAARRVGEYLQRGQLGAGLQRAEALLTDGALVPQLDDVDSAGQRGVDELGEVTALATRIGAQVQAGLGEAGPSGTRRNMARPRR